MNEIVASEALHAALKQHNIKLLALGQGDYTALKAFGRMTKFSGTLVTDLQQPKLPAYRALGAQTKGKDGCAFICEQIFKGTKEGIQATGEGKGGKDLLKGFSLFKTNLMIQAGCLLFDEKSTCVYQHMFTDTKSSEHWPIDEMIAKMSTM